MKLLILQQPQSPLDNLLVPYAQPHNNVQMYCSFGKKCRFKMQLLILHHSHSNSFDSLCMPLHNNDRIIISSIDARTVQQ